MALLICSCMDGCKPCIFACAQTGSGAQTYPLSPIVQAGYGAHAFLHAKHCICHHFISNYAELRTCTIAFAASDAESAPCVRRHLPGFQISVAIS